MKSEVLNDIITLVPGSNIELIKHVFDNPGILVAINAEKILHSSKEMKVIINNNIGYPDGIGAVWALKKKGHIKAKKIPGCELWLDIIKEYSGSKKFYLVGSTQETIETTIRQLYIDFPGIEICNYRNGYLKSEEEVIDLIEDIKITQPDVIFVAMGSPKQEKLMMRLQSNHTAVYQGLGGSFDVYTKKVKRAPTWWIDNNLEWAYRLLNEPTRIKRQIHLLRFFINLNLGRY